METGLPVVGCPGSRMRMRRGSRAKFNQYKDNSKMTKKKNIFVKDIKEQAHTNVNSQDDMYNKSLAMLNERLKNGLITLEEFNRQVKKLARKRR